MFPRWKLEKPISEYLEKKNLKKRLPKITLIAMTPSIWNWSVLISTEISADKIGIRATEKVFN